MSYFRLVFQCIISFDLVKRLLVQENAQGLMISEASSTSQFPLLSDDYLDCAVNSLNSFALILLNRRCIWLVLNSINLYLYLRRAEFTPCSPGMLNKRASSPSLGRMRIRVSSLPSFTKKLYMISKSNGGVLILILLLHSIRLFVGMILFF